MNCKDCKWSDKTDHRLDGGMLCCENPLFFEADCPDDGNPDQIERGVFFGGSYHPGELLVGRKFGCVHFEEK